MTTESHKQEAALKRVQEQSELQLNILNAVVRATKIGIWDITVVNNDPVHPDNVFLWSDEFRHMLGYKDTTDFPNTMESWSDKLHPDDKEKTFEAVRKHISDKTGKTPYDSEYRLLKKNGEYSYFQVYGESIRDNEGNVLRVAGAIMDITETKNILLNSERQRIAAEAANTAKSSFLSMMSHEIRTPINAIIGMTSIGKTAADIDKKDYCFAKIEDASIHLLGVINDVLDMSKIEADKFELSPVEFNFEKMVKKVLAVISYRIEEKQQQLTVNIDSNIPPFVVGDDQRLSQVITNLLSNAVKFTPEKGEIRLAASFAGEENGICELKIKVTDNGIGISAEQQAKLFNTFAQAESGTSRKFGGTGLGLAISKRIVELMDGRIWVESELGKGACFEFTVKVGRGKEGTDLEKDKSTIKIKENEFAGKKMLLAEDVEINREIIITLLQGTGLVIDYAENGKEALEMIKASSSQYDIVFMDVQMPEMDGLEATRLIRKLEKGSDIPIIAMTANVFKSDIEECIQAGMNDHIGKPLDIDKVMELLWKFLK